MNADNELLTTIDQVSRELREDGMVEYKCTADGEEETTYMREPSTARSNGTSVPSPLPLLSSWCCGMQRSLCGLEL